MHPSSMNGVFVVNMVHFCILGYPKCVLAFAQSDQNFRRAHISEGKSSDVPAQISIKLEKVPRKRGYGIKF